VPSLNAQAKYIHAFLYQMHGEEEADRDSVGDILPGVVRLSSTSLASTSSSGSGSDPRPKTVTPTPGVCIELQNLEMC
jgi:hypothetical protein